MPATPSNDRRINDESSRSYITYYVKMCLEGTSSLKIKHNKMMVGPIYTKQLQRLSHMRHDNTLTIDSLENRGASATPRAPNGVVRISACYFA